MNDLVPNIGDTRIRLLSSGDKVRETFMACVQCGRGRWQVLRHGVTNRPICRKCSSSNRMKDSVYKEKIMAGSRRRWATPGAREKMSEMIRGEKNYFYGKKHTPEMLAILSKPRVKINITHSREWGYFIGLVLGDGCIARTKKNHKILVSSTRPEIVDKFKECCIKLHIHCVYYHSDNGVQRYVAEVISKKLYTYLRPYKYEDYHFTIPDIVYRYRKMLCGFLQGFYDAEGGAYKGSSPNNMTIESWSKHLSNLIQVQDLLHMLGIKSYLIQEKKARLSARLVIGDYESRLLFRQNVGFRIERKQARLEDMKEPTNKTHSLQLYKEALSLRAKGCSYGQIAKAIGISRITVYGWCTKKSPKILKTERYYLKRRQEMLDVLEDTISSCVSSHV